MPFDTTKDELLLAWVSGGQRAAAFIRDLLEELRALEMVMTTLTATLRAIANRALRMEWPPDLLEGQGAGGAARRDPGTRGV